MSWLATAFRVSVVSFDASGLVPDCGVTVSAFANSTLVAIAVLWMILYGGGFLLSLLPPGSFPSPDRALHNLPEILKGFYDWQALSRVMLASLAVSLTVATVGMVFFSRRDV